MPTAFDAHMSTSVTSAGAQIVGSRDHQEDCFVIHRDVAINDGTKGILAIVCDGMGGHVKGDVASKLGCESFYTEFVEKIDFDLNDRLVASLGAANDAIGAAIREQPEQEGMGTTLVAVVVRENTLHWVSVGDSPLWLRRGRILKRLNADHSMAPVLDKLAEIGEITMDEAKVDKSRTRLRSALTGGKIDHVDIPEESLILQSGDQVVLASDGVESLQADELLRLLRGGGFGEPEKQAQALLKKVSQKNLASQDNATVVILKYAAETPGLATKLKRMGSRLRLIKP